MIVTLGQLLLGTYGLTYFGTAAAWKKHRVAVLVIGAILPVFGVFGYNRIDQQLASYAQQDAVFASMAPEWQSLYQALEATDSTKVGEQVREALMVAFQNTVPTKGLTAAEYEQFVKLDAASTLCLSDRVIFDPTPQEVERSAGAVESLLASLNSKIDSIDTSQKITFQTGEAPAIDLTDGATLAKFR